ncbi:hypothetical protein [Nocardia cyriacigeorgica]|uniref:hypothetical protein n=1 Tax=Nocardia cyriacigeorgica TaxID=135487 RepID=UPI001894F28A|nr:hypothetical protein [Nocardia cyriacigeorgica]MBF6326781.1 hypothetical protein [Nocardia cyriacigeorgica]
MLSRYLAGVLRNLADRIDPPPRRGTPHTHNLIGPDPAAALAAVERLQARQSAAAQAAVAKRTGRWSR